jgi:hypothetical protein
MELNALRSVVKSMQQQIAAVNRAGTAALPTTSSA